MSQMTVLSKPEVLSSTPGAARKTTITTATKMMADVSFNTAAGALLISRSSTSHRAGLSSGAVSHSET
jgi:hypothetical protein